MPIDTTGEFWRGSDPDDVDSYLRAYMEDSYPVGRVIACTCACGSNQLYLDADADEGCARWTCSKCELQRFVGDSEEYWEQAEPERAVCPECNGETYNIAVGFSLRENGDVKWLTIGNRCVECGLLGSFVDWKIDYTPTDHLFTRV